MLGPRAARSARCVRAAPRPSSRSRGLAETPSACRWTRAARVGDARGRRAAAGRDPEGALPRRARADPGRADGGADAAGEWTSCSACCARAQRRGTTIVLITHKLGRGEGARRPRHGDARRAAWWDRRDGGALDRGDRRADGGPHAHGSSRARRAPAGRAVARACVTSRCWTSAGLRGAARTLAHGRGRARSVGVAGVEGNGAARAGRVDRGPEAAARGQIRDRRAPGLRRARCAERFAAGLAHIPSDRLRRGLVRR